MVFMLKHFTVDEHGGESSDRAIWITARSGWIMRSRLMSTGKQFVAVLQAVAGWIPIGLPRTDDGRMESAVEG